jgi:hypothetical protein
MYVNVYTIKRIELKVLLELGVPDEVEVWLRRGTRNVG